MNPLIVAQPASEIRSINARKRASSIDLGLGEPLLAPEIADFERATNWVRENACRYSSNAGDADLRAAIARTYAYPSLDSPENVCIATGSQETVYATFKALLDPASDEVLLVEPTYPIYARIAAIEGISIRRVAMSADEDFALDPERILAALSPATRMIVICSPCNPTGRAMTRDAARSLAEALRVRPGPPVYVFHDEVYREIRFTDDIGALGEYYPQTISINSLSKSNTLTGLRLGWAIGPLDAMRQIVKVHAWVTSCASTFAQRVALEIFARKGLADTRSWYDSQRKIALAAARDVGLRTVIPEGAFYLWIETGATNARDFVSKLIEEADVVAMPGTIFGEDPTLQRWLRTSFVAPQENLREGMKRIAEVAASFNVRR
ncbi:MAG TPA: pyridoxal phosphate-dependent aminotransferase [Candidatus Baltobacteraceae bacterium]|jgi:aspartate/methionine/tyrosine aminotransferase|nr:pyridoxal phosphate-dependent aminotransferase [Candidatus Baltobacteraceae bacterium]